MTAYGIGFKPRIALHMCEISQDRLLAFFLQFMGSRTQTGMKKETARLQLKKED